MGQPSASDTTDDYSLRDLLRLALVDGIGPKTWDALLERFGTASAVLSVPVGQLRSVPGVGTKLAKRIAAARSFDADAVLDRCGQLGITVLTRSDEQYPRLLKKIPDPPIVLFCRGNLESRDELAIAIVGTRHPTAYGLRQAERLAAGLARAGFTIVSGLARGIDAAAHKGALSAGGRTLAVLAGDLIDVYPPEHKELAQQISCQGALLSEWPPGTVPLAGNFPRRNRLVSGMCLGVIVVEAPRNSGALITAGHALEQGREVFALPGRVEDRTSAGCHKLIRDGATLIESVEDVIEQLGPLAQPVATSEREVHHPRELLLTELEQCVLDAVRTDPTTTDEVVEATGLPISRVLATLSVLEMRRLIRRLSGDCVVRL